MVLVHRFQSIDELQKLQKLAGSVDEDVFLHSPDDSIIVDAKSFINLFTLDFSKDVKIVTESEKVIKSVEKWK